MKIEITDKAEKYLKSRMPNAKAYLVVADDGSNEYSVGHGGACTIGDAFEVVGVDKVKPQFDTQLENDKGLDVYTDKNDLKYFGPGLKLDFNDAGLNNFLQLKDNDETIDSQVVTNDQV